jgi:hypothetical protein
VSITGRCVKRSTFKAVFNIARVRTLGHKFPFYAATKPTRGVKWGMPQINHYDRVAVNVDGVDHMVFPGTYSMQAMIALVKLDAKARRVDLQSRPALATM